MPTESAARRLSATSARRRPIRVFWKKNSEPRDHDERDGGGRDVDLLQRDEAAEDLEVDRAFGKVELLGDHDLGVAAEHELAEADEEIGEPERRHEQDDVGLVDERAQHQAFHSEGEAVHDQGP